MFMYRSAIFLIRTVCPEVILGLSTFDELQDINGEVVDVSPVEVTAKLIPQTEKVKEKLKRGRTVKAPETPPEAPAQEADVSPAPEPEKAVGGATVGPRPISDKMLELIKANIARTKYDEEILFQDWEISGFSELTESAGENMLKFLITLPDVD
jgi:hypothetical protein